MKSTFCRTWSWHLVTTRSASPSRMRRRGRWPACFLTSRFRRSIRAALTLSSVNIESASASSPEPSPTTRRVVPARRSRARGRADLPGDVTHRADRAGGDAGADSRRERRRDAGSVAALHRSGVHEPPCGLRHGPSGRELAGWRVRAEARGIGGRHNEPAAQCDLPSSRASNSTKYARAGIVRMFCETGHLFERATLEPTMITG